MGISGTGLVLPAGHNKETISLEGLDLIVTLEKVAGENEGLFDANGEPATSEHLMADCVYPDGFKKSHQVKGVADLAEKITNIMKSRYGLESVPFLEIPSELKTNERFLIGA